MDILAGLYLIAFRLWQYVRETKKDKESQES
jgi:hypothetical protein